MAKDEELPELPFDLESLAELLVLAAQTPDTLKPERKIALAVEMITAAQEALKEGRLKAAHLMLMGSVHSLVLAAMQVGRQAIGDDELLDEALADEANPN